MSSIKDVARIAGVSTATVSRTLSEPEKVAEETRRKVEEAINRIGYVRNALARSFRMQRTQTILVLLPDIGNPFYSLIIQGLEEVAQHHHYRLLIGDTQNQPAREREYLQAVWQRQVDGVISLGHKLPDIPALKNGKRIPIVMACEYLHDEAVSSVSIDNIAAAELATRHLLELGHRRIAFINGPAHTPLSKDRLQGYRNALQGAGLKYDARLVRRGDFSLASGEKAMQDLFRDKHSFSALFASSDAMAIGAMKALRMQGLRIPGDVSVVGFDDIEFTQYVEPPLTTVHQPRREIGRVTMQKMIAELANRSEKMVRVVLAHQMVLRNSTAPCSASIHGERGIDDAAT